MAKIHISALAAIILASTAMVSQVNAEDIASPANVISSDTIAPTLVLSSGTTPLWDMAGGVNNYRIFDYNSGNTVVRIGTSADNSDSVVVGLGGNIGLASNAVYINRGTKQMGIGTTAPEDALHVAGNGNITLEMGTTSKWRIGTRSTGGIVLQDLISGNNPFEIAENAPTDSLHIGEDGNVGLGTDAPSAKLDVNGTVKNNDTITSEWSGSNTVGDGLTNLMVLSANNSDGATSDAGFVLLNAKENKQWNFRTTRGGNGFAATIQGTGGTEFEVVNDTNDFKNAKLYIGGKLIFANGKIQAGVLP